MPSIVRVLALIWMMVGISWPVRHSAAGQLAVAGRRDAPQGTPSLVTMDFQDVDVAVLVKFISQITGKNFILDERVHGKITIISPTKMSMDEAYRAFQSALHLKGFMTVPAGAVIKIVPAKDVRSSPIDTVVQ